MLSSPLWLDAWTTRQPTLRVSCTGTHIPRRRPGPPAYSEPARGVAHILPLTPPLTGKGRFKPETDKVSVMLGKSEGCARTVRLRTGRAANLDDV